MTSPDADTLARSLAPADAELARAKTDLHWLHSRWQYLTQEESAAITAANWALVLQHQTAKKNLQQETTSAKQRLEEIAERCGTGWTQLRGEFLPKVEELIDLESRNLDLLATHLHQARARFQETNQAAFNLLQLRNAYAGGQDSIWQSYS